MSQPRAFRLGTIAIAALALAFALVATVPSAVRPEVASAQTFCNGGYYPYGTTCTLTTGVSCSGVFYANTSTCPNTGSYCNGAYYPTGTVCGTNATFCSGYYPPIGNVCPPTTSTYCNGAYYPTGTICSTSAGVYCNGTYFPATTVCSTSTSVSCNGGIYASLDLCPSFACPGGGFPGQACYSTSVVCAKGQDCPAVLSAYPPSGVSSASYAPISVSYAPSSTTYAPSTNTYAPSTNSYGGFSVSYSGGWNIVAGPSGTTLTGTVGPLYTLRAGDTAYESLPSGAALTSGAGYWAYFGANATTAIGTAGAGSVTIPLPAGQFVMIGNPGNTTATVTGADVVLVYQRAMFSGMVLNTLPYGYNQTTSLGPGQGAWAMSSNGGQVTITNGSN